MNKPHLIRFLVFFTILFASFGLARPGQTSDAINGLPTVTITAPTSGEVINTAHVEVTFSLSDFVVGPWDTPYVAFFLDDNPTPFDFFNGSDGAQFGNKTVISGFAPTPAATWLDDDTLRFNALPNGSHTITAHLADAQGNLLTNPEASFTVTFTIDQTPDNVEMPNALLFVKEQFNPATPPPNAAPGMGRVFNNMPPAVGDLYLLSPATPDGTLYQLTDVAANGGGVVDPEVSYDGERVVFAMRATSMETWHIWEMNLDGTNLRQITFDPPFMAVNDQDPEYLPDGRILFVSDRLQQREMKPYDQAITTQLYVVNPDGSDLRQLDYNANFGINPQVATDGRILFDRWDHLNFIRNLFTLWRMNQDGTNGFVNYGGVSPRFDQQNGENANAIESRELSTGEMVGIFTNRESMAGKMGIFDARSFNNENLPFPLMVGPTGFYRTPYQLTNDALIYSYTPSTDPLHNGFGLYTMQLTPESVLVDDTTVSTAPGPFTNNSFRTYNINLEEAGRIYLEVSGIADDNGFLLADRAWVRVDGVVYDGGEQDIERKLDGDLTFGKPYSYRIDIDLAAGPHTVNIATFAWPTITHVRIMRAIAATNHTVFYDDPTTNEVSPIPVRVRNLPPTYPSQINTDLNWGTVVVRDISLRGDFRQANFDDPDGDPSYPYHMDLNQIQGLRVKQNLSRRSEAQDMLVGAPLFDPVRVVGVATPNASGTVAFKVLANVTTAWDLIDDDGGAIAHERVWSWVQPGETRSCGGCHEGAFPYDARPIGPIPSAQDLRERGEVYSFVDQVLPIFQQRCDNCHTGQNPDGDLDLTGDRATFDALTTVVPGRMPEQYILPGDARYSFLYQLLSGKTDITPLYTFRLNQINNQANHTTMLSSSELYEVATWLDTGAGFAYLPEGVHQGVPEVVSVLPADGTNGIKRNTGVSVHFNAPIDRATINNSTFVLRRSNGNIAYGTWTWGTNQDVYFQPNGNLSSGSYQLTISGPILDIQDGGPGTALGGTFTSSFNVVSGYDNNTPQTVALLPSGNDTNPFEPVTVRFNKAINPGSVNERTLTVTDSQGFYVDGRIYVSANGLETKFFPWSSFTAGETYTVHLNNGIYDLAENDLNPVSYSFTIATQPTAQYHSQITQIPTNIDPKGMAINQAGTEILVTGKYDNKVTRYVVGTWAQIANYPVAAGPSEVAYAKDGTKAYVLNTTANNVQILDLGSGAILATIEAGLVSPFRLLVNHAGNRLYISDIGNTGYIHEVDVVAGSPTFGQLLRTFDLGKVPSRPAISADDKTIYYGSPLAFNIFDVASASETASIYVPYGTVSPVVLSPDGAFALAPATSGQAMRFIDLYQNKDRGEIRLPDDPDHMVLSGDGRFLYMLMRESQTLAVMDMKTWQVVADLPASGDESSYMQGLAISPDSQLIFAVEGGLASNVLVYHVADPNDVTPPTVLDHAPAADSVDQAVHVPIRVNFSEPIDRLTLNTTTFSVTDSSGAPVAGSIHVSLDSSSADFMPANWLTTNETFTVSLNDGVHDQAGNSLAPLSYAFTTVPTPQTQYHGQVAQMSTDVDPKRMDINDAGTEILVTNKYNNLLTRYAVGSWEQIGVYTVPGGPSDVQYSSDGSKAYVLGSTNKSIQIVNLSTTDIIASITTPMLNPDRLRLNHAGTRLYVSDTGGTGYIHEIDVVIGSPTFGQVVRTFNLGRIPSRPAIGDDDTTLYFGSPFAFNIFDLSGANITNSIYLPYGTVAPVALAPSGDFALAPSSNSLAMRLIDLRIEQDRGPISLPDNIDHLTIAPDGRYIYIILRNTQGMAVLDTASMQIVDNLPGLEAGVAFVQSLVVSPDNQQIYAVAGGLAADILVFEMADPEDVTPPVLDSAEPANGSSDNPVITPIRFSFSETLDRLTVTTDTISLTNDGGVAVDGNFHISPNGMSISFLPASLLNPAQTYTVSLSSDVRDVAGNSLSPTAYSFSTAGPVSQHHSQVAAINTDADPKRMAVNHAGTEIIVANKFNDLLIRYAMDTWEELGRYPVGPDPYDVAYSADDTLVYVLNSGDKSVQFVNLSDGTIAATTTGFLNPERLTLNHIGTRLYVNDLSEGSIREIDVETGSPTFGQIVRTFTLGKPPSRPAISPDDQHLYFGTPLGFNILDISTGNVLKNIPLPYGTVSPVVISPDGTFALAPSGNTLALRLIDLTIHQDQGEIALPDNPDHMALSPDGRFLYMVMRTSQDIVVMDMGTMQIVAELPAEGNGITYPQSLVISPDSQYIFFVAGGLASQVLVYQPGDMDDITPPTVTNLSPGNATDVPIHAPISASFSEALDRLSINNSTISIVDGSGATVAGNFYINPNSTSVSFLPATLLDPAQTYTVSLSSGLHDLAGNSLTPASFSFNTVNGPLPQHHSQVAALNTDADPKRMAVNHAGTEIIIASKFTDQLIRYDLNTWQELARYPVALDPYDVAYAVNDAQVYVLNTGDKSVQVLNLGDGAILHTTTGFVNPIRLTTDHGGTRLYVTDTGANAIHEMDVAVGSPTFGQVLRTFSFSNAPSRPVVSPNDQYLYFGAPLTFNILSLATGAVVTNIALPYGTVNPVVVSADGSFALAPSNNTLALRLIDLTTRQDRGEIPLPDNPDHMALSPDGRYLYMVMRTTPNAITVMDLGTLEIVTQMPAQGNNTTFAQSLVVSPDSQYVFFVAGSFASQVLVYQPGDMNDITPPTITDLTPDNATEVPVYVPIGASFSEAMDRLSINESSVWLANAGTPLNGTLTISLDNQHVNFTPAALLDPGVTHTLYAENTLTDLAGNPLGQGQSSSFTTAATLDPGPLYQMSATFSSNGSRGLAVSPDGSLLAVANRFQNSVSLLDPVTMQSLRVAINVSDGPRGLSFNSDGSRLYVVTNPGNTLVEINVATGQVLRAIPNVLANEEVTISSDNAYAYTTGFNNSAFNVINLATQQVTSPLGAVDRPGRPAYAPDGTLYLPTNNTLWRQNSNGSWMPIPTNSSYVVDVAFSADGRYAFLAETWRDALQVLDLTQDHVLTEVPLGDEPRQMAQSGDHRYLFVTNKTSATIQIVDTLTLEIVRETELPNSQMTAVAWDDLGQRLYVSDIVSNAVYGFSLNTATPPPTILDNTSYGVQYGHWTGVSDANATGGGYRATSTAGEWITYKTPAVTEFSLITYVGPDQGYLNVKVDNVLISTVDLYAPTPEYHKVFTFSQLNLAQHTIALVAVGANNPASSGMEVRIDGLIVNGQTINDTNLGITYQSWSGLSAAWASNNATHLASTPGSSITFAVEGDAFIWRTAHCPSCGQVEVTVDGNVFATIDLYHPSWQIQYGQLINGLGSGSHQVTLTILSSKNPASSGMLVLMDGYSHP